MISDGKIGTPATPISKMTDAETAKYFNIVNMRKELKGSYYCCAKDMYV